MNRLTIAALGLACAAGAASAADVVLMKNGDRISGTIVKMEGETLTITTPYMEKIGIDWKEVASVQSDTPHIVRTKPDDFVNAKLKSAPDGIVLEGGGLRSGRTIRPEEVATLDIPPGAQWTGAIQANVAGTTGNIDTFAMGGRAEAIRKTDDDRLRFGLSSDIRQADVTTTVVGTNGQQVRSTKNVQTGQKHNAWILYDYNLDDHWSIGGYARFDHDRFKDLNYRALIGGGPRYRVWDTKLKHLSFYLGGAYIFEELNSRSTRPKFVLNNPTSKCATDANSCPSESRDFITLALGDEFRTKLTDTLGIYQLLDIYPSLEDTSDVLFHFEAGLRQQVMGGLFVGLGIGDDYDTKPADGRKKNDFLYFGNVGYEF